ncbi:MAG TPA: DUF805 domain-containing protein [Acidobacteria bacterium]|nr:DUF805 domain-containing protein [Acidobacteriota bacterium]
MTDSDHTPSPTHCISCGAEVPDHAKFCQACGSAVYRPEDTSQPPESAAAEAPVPEAETNLIAEGLSPELSAKGGKGFTFFEAVGSGFSKCLVFSGRALRSEYWYFYLFSVLGGISIGFVEGAYGVGPDDPQLLGNLFVLGVSFPMFALNVRRLHDVDRSGWWILIAFTVVGLIPLWYWMCKEGDPDGNRYGPPVYRPEDES